jgi:ribosome biogenesis GTPase A
MNQQKNVHYFPGHMKKAQDHLSELVKICDLVIEIADARAPFSTRNPMLRAIIGSKPHILLLSKGDKADPKIVEEWVTYFGATENLFVRGVNLKRERLGDLAPLLEAPLSAKRAKEERMGMKKQPARLLVVGIPNVGKSTFINSLAGHAIAKVEDRPGVTRAEQWIKLPSGLLLLDTPGILPTNYPDGAMAVRLALLGSIKEEVLPVDDLAYSLLGYLREEYPLSLQNRYGIGDLTGLSSENALQDIASKSGLLLSGGFPDESKAASRLIRDFQDGLLGPIVLERPHA